MKTLVNIYAQVEENYGAHNWDGQGDCPQHWKKKGGRIFQVNLNVDYLMYDEERSVNAFKRLLQDKSHEGYRYTYTDHEIVWQEPTKLDDDKFLEYVHAQTSDVDVEY